MKKILVIQNKRIGDVLISSVIANNIKTVFPKSEVTYFVYDYTTGVLENNPNIDRVISVNESYLKKPIHLWQHILKIRQEKYDIIFDPYSKFQSRMMCLFSGAKYRIGLKRKHKTLKLPFYTHPINLLDSGKLKCGKAIEDRINLISSVFPLKDADYQPKIYLTSEEKEYSKLKSVQRPIIMLGVLGSTPQKSLPHEAMRRLIDFITQKYDGTVLFNFAPHQKEEALKIYNLCENKNQIRLDIYEENIRGFIQLINQCDMLISNEGGSVHISKALQIPTFTIYSPYVNKAFWGGFEDGKQHDSIHLLEEKPDLFTSFTLEARRKIEKNPQILYAELTPEMILSKLTPFLERHFSVSKK